METRVLPGSLIMAPGGIKYTPISLGTYPGPRLIITVAQYRTVFFVMFLVYIGFVPACKPGESFHHRMVGFGNTGAEGAHTMAGKRPARTGIYSFKVMEVTVLDITGT